MSSFTRTIPKDQDESFVDAVLARADHYIPLAYRPTRANPGDFIYLVYRGKIVGRAKIAAINKVVLEASETMDHYPDWARWIICYQGDWGKPPREIPVQGHQSVKYLETHALEHLDGESW